jgi:hypothetical protein
MSEPRYEFSIEADGVARDADGNLLDKDGNPIGQAPDEETNDDQESE